MYSLVGPDPTFPVVFGGVLLEHFYPWRMGEPEPFSTVHSAKLEEAQIAAPTVPAPPSHGALPNGASIW